jgi:hypothetical protein
VDAGTSGIYLYGIVTGDRPLPGGPGIDGLHPIYRVAWGNVRAVVSTVSLAEFGEAPLQEKFRDFSWMEMKIRAHERILEDVMRGQSVLPCRFCTIYRSDQRVRHLLVRHYQQCLDALKALQDMEEWGIKAYVHEEVLRTHLLQVDTELQRMERECRQRPPGSAYLLRRRLAQRVMDRLEQVSMQLNQQVVQTLRLHAVSAEEIVSSLPPPSPMGLRLIVNEAYLIPKMRVSSFAAAAQMLGESLHDQGIQLVRSGPWPPYHFSPRLELSDTPPQLE